MRLGWEMPEKESEQDTSLEQALKDFRLSVRTWSEAEYSLPRQSGSGVRLTSWRVALGWALGCVLAVGSLTGGLYEHHHKQELAKIAAAAAAARQQKLDAEMRTRNESEDLLAKVDNDVSRQVPRAMEPLALLMSEDEAQ
jgi:hypothetical protein